MQSKLGWTEAALVEGAKDAKLSPAIVGAFPRKEAALVEVENLDTLFFLSLIYSTIWCWNGSRFNVCFCPFFVVFDCLSCFYTRHCIVQFFMDECSRHLEDEVEAREKELSSMLLAERIAQIVRLRLQMQIPFLSKWPQALSIQVMRLSTVLISTFDGHRLFSLLSFASLEFSFNIFVAPQHFGFVARAGTSYECRNGTETKSCSHG